MRLTKKKAIQISIELWEYMAETGEGRKGKWEGWKEYGEMSCDCALCEYEEQRGGGGDECDHCPYWQKFGNCWDDAPYDKWRYAKTKATRKKYAELLLEQLRQL